MNKHEIEPFVGHGCFKVYEMFYIIKKDVNFHTFETLDKKMYSNVFATASFFYSSNNLSTLQWKQKTIHQPCYHNKLQMWQPRLNMNTIQS